MQFIKNKKLQLILNNEIIQGTMSKRALRMIFEWLEMHRSELLEDWGISKTTKTIKANTTFNLEIG